MALSALDRAFLGDIAATNWLQHFIAAASFLRSGAESGQPEDGTVLKQVVERHNVPENLQLWSRMPIVEFSDLTARVQALMTLRMFQERVSATETFGMLLCALHDRKASGIARAHYYMSSGRVTNLLREIADRSDFELSTYIGWPAQSELAGCTDAEFVTRCQRLYPKLQEWTKQVAVAYTDPEEVSLGTLGHPCDGYDPRGSVFIVLYREEHWQDQAHQRRNLIEQAYNKLKHGFNATAVYLDYEAAASQDATAVVLEIPKTNEMVQRLGKETDLIGVMCREIARMTLEHDAQGLMAG